MSTKSYKIIADKTKMTHEEWLSLRKFSIGGSEIAVAIGVSRWSTPFQLWSQKTGRSIVLALCGCKGKEVKNTYQTPNPCIGVQSWNQFCVKNLVNVLVI